MRRRVVVFPGSFDPLTKGHINVIERGVEIFDEVIVAVAVNLSKNGTFNLDERLEILRDIFTGREDISVDCFDGLLVDYVKKKGTNVILRGLRTVTDFEYELTMALANKSICPEVETVFLVSASTYGHISSSLIKEVVALGGSVSNMVPPAVEEKLRAKLLEKKMGGGG